MPNVETRRLQTLGVEGLQEIFPQEVRDKPIIIKREWKPFIKRNYPDMSSPIIDIAVGPFATEERLIREYDELLGIDFIKILIDIACAFHFQNLDRFGIPKNLVGLDDFNGNNFTNTNARCFFAIEIEGRKDRKVVLSDIFNTSAMGRIGIIVANSNDVLRIFLRLLYYFWFLKRVGKPSLVSSNVIILSKEQFESLFTIYYEPIE
jgi:hypothetical protein